VLRLKGEEKERPPVRGLREKRKRLTLHQMKPKKKESSVRRHGNNTPILNRREKGFLLPPITVKEDKEREGKYQGLRGGLSFKKKNNQKKKIPQTHHFVSLRNGQRKRGNTLRFQSVGEEGKKRGRISNYYADFAVNSSKKRGEKRRRAAKKPS